MPQRPGGSGMISDDLVSEVPKHDICHIHLVHQVTEAGPGLWVRVRAQPSVGGAAKSLQLT